MNSVDIFIFSKDRACQLDLCIRSIKEKMPFVNNIYCLYKSSNELSAENYFKVFSQYDIVCIQETDFESDVKDIVRMRIGSEYIMCMTDDDVFINDVSKEEFDMLISEYKEDVLSLSMRMNPTTNFCYPAIGENQNMIPPQFIESDKFLKWNWTLNSCASDWGYPMCLNEHVYKKSYFWEMIKYLKFIHPNALEGELNNKKRDINKSYMISFKQSKLFNCMQNFVKPGGGTVYKDYSVENLNTIYMSGKRISTKNIYGMVKQQCHGQIDFEYEEY